MSNLFGRGVEDGMWRRFNNSHTDQVDCVPNLHLLQNSIEDMVMWMGSEDKTFSATFLQSQE